MTDFLEDFQLRYALLACLGILLFLWFTRIPIGSEKRVRVVYVCDGDTLIVRGWLRRFRVRLAGLDAPEGNQPGGEESREVLDSMVGDRGVILSVIDKDHWGRYVCFVRCHGLQVNLEMVRLGQAWAYKQYFYNLKPEQRRAFSFAEKEAKAKRRGIWSLPNPEKPWEHRKKHRSFGTWLHFLWLRILNLLFGKKSTKVRAKH